MNHLGRISTSLALAAFVSSTFAHARLQHSTPANGETLLSAPGELRLQYNEAVEPALSSVKVWGPGSRPVTIEKAKASPSDDNVLLVKLPLLSAGAYRVEWSTMGHDGHRTRGSVNFTVK